MPTENTVPFSSDDPEMESAIREAKTSFRQFLETFFKPTRRQKSFLVKVVFDEAGQREHLWLADLQFRGTKPSGVVAVEPTLPSLRFMQRVEFELSYISDWMYVDDGCLVGGFTTQVIRERMTPEARRVHDAQAPYKFRSLA